jgi:hypothetical protein
MTAYFTREDVQQIKPAHVRLFSVPSYLVLVRTPKFYFSLHIKTHAGTTNFVAAQTEAQNDG